MSSAMARSLSCTGTPMANLSLRSLRNRLGQCSGMSPDVSPCWASSIGPPPMNDPGSSHAYAPPSVAEGVPLWLQAALRWV
jgi:hypothetical protein